MNAIDVLEKLEDESIDMILTLPPYWSLRDFGKETVTIWDGDPQCRHAWKRGFCKQCSAWRGQIGHELDISSIFNTTSMCLIKKIRF